MFKLSVNALFSRGLPAAFKAANCEGEIEQQAATPLIYLKALSEETGCAIYGKAEFMNPGGSVKDRAARGMLREAEKKGLLKPGGTLVEGTGGNTGIALAALGAAKGYKVILTMPKIIAKEKVQSAERYGAKVILQPLVPFADPENYARKAEQIAQELGENAIFTNQFENLANYRAHFSTTGPEIWSQTAGSVDSFVTSAGTGGTLAGVSSFLKQASGGRVQCFLVDPSGSILFNFVEYGRAVAEGNSEIEGIGIGRITNNFKQGELDGALRGTDREAIEMAYWLMKHEGLCVGPSAALNVVGAVKVARRLGKGKVIVTILCDGGERYASKIFDEDWLAKHFLTPSSQSQSQSNSRSLDFVK